VSQRWQHDFLQCLERHVVAEKTGDVDGEVVEELVVLGGVLVQDAGVVGVCFGAASVQPPGEPPRQGALFILPEVEAPFAVDLLQETLQFLAVLSHTTYTRET